MVAVANVHLPSSPYGPYRLRDGVSHDEVIALEERVRLSAIQEQLSALEDLAARGIPAFLTGDFNSPSHLDWTEAADDARDDVPFPVEWPVPKALAAAGFFDSYRSVNPDPVAEPGFTWTPGGPESVKREVHDRIDWVLAGGPVEATASRVVGEAGNESVDLEVDPWPSDHRGVVSTFDMTPAETPTLTAVADRLVEQPDPLEARSPPAWSGSEEGRAEYAILRPGESFRRFVTRGGARPTNDEPTSGGRRNARCMPAARRSSRYPGAEEGRTTSIDGDSEVGTHPLAPGTYDAALVDDGHAIDRLALLANWPGPRSALYEPGSAHRDDRAAKRPLHEAGEPIVARLDEGAG